MIKVLLSTLLYVIMIPTVWSAGNADRGKTLITACAACHGKDGNSHLSLFPKLAEQQPSYLIKQLKDIQSGKRKVPEMTTLLNKLNTQDFSDIAAYFAQQTISIGTANANLAQQGETLYRFGDPSANIPACASCHGPAGQGINSAHIPALNGQFSDYTKKQLQRFKTHQRHNDLNNIMQSIAGKLSDTQINAVASYLQGLKENKLH